MEGNSKDASTRRTLRSIPPPILERNVISYGDVSNDSVVFYTSQDGTAAGQISENPCRPLVHNRQHQIISVPNHGDVNPIAPLTVSTARQDARVHIFTAALLEHICSLYEINPSKRQKIFQEICSRLTDRDMLSPIAFLDTFALWREKYISGFSELMRATVTLVDSDPANATRYQPPSASNANFWHSINYGVENHLPQEYNSYLYTLFRVLTADSHLRLSLITNPTVAPLMRTPSDPRSSFFSSRYSSDFHEIKSIGSGGFGSVYKVKNKLDEVLYAVKKIRLKRLNHEKCRKLLREVKLLATLNHPSIVRYNSAWMEQDPNGHQHNEARIHEVSDDTEISSSEGSISHNNNQTGGDDPFENERIVLYIQMELCHSNLHDWLTKRNKRLLSVYPHPDVYGHVHESENMHFTRQLLSGLDYIHTQSIIHRDIKTRNIFIGNHGALKIGDFGLARDIVISPSPTGSEFVPDWDSAGGAGATDVLSKGIGTSIYSSPEQQSQRVYDSKTDIYSAGIILFELYCPFSTEMERYDQIKKLRNNKAIPKELLTRWPEQMVMLEMMVDADPVKRPSAKKLLDSDLYLDKDQIISHLESRIEELETKHEMLKQDYQLLQATMQQEAADYKSFLQWKNSLSPGSEIKCPCF